MAFGFQESFLLPVPPFGGGSLARPVSPLAEEAEGGSEEGDPGEHSVPHSAPHSAAGSGTPAAAAAAPSSRRPPATVTSAAPASGGVASSSSSGTRAVAACLAAASSSAGIKTSSSLLRKCYPSSSTQAPFLPSGRLEDCLPPCYHGAKTMPKLIKVRTYLQVSIFFHKFTSELSFFSAFLFCVISLILKTPFLRYQRRLSLKN